LLELEILDSKSFDYKPIIQIILEFARPGFLVPQALVNDISYIYETMICNHKMDDMTMGCRCERRLQPDHFVASRFETKEFKDKLLLAEFKDGKANSVINWKLFAGSFKPKYLHLPILSENQFIMRGFDQYDNRSLSFIINAQTVKKVFSKFDGCNRTKLECTHIHLARGGSILELTEIRY
jgi:hypothetical protein